MYRASVIADEIRDRATEGSFVDCPIVLFSTQENIKNIYPKNSSILSRYDSFYEKMKIPDEAPRIANELVSLVKGYRVIRHKMEDGSVLFYKILNISSDDFELFDPHIFDEFTGTKSTAHDYALFIIHEIIQIPGLLIDENLLAARLGIDRKNSQDWDKVKERLSQKTAYTGPFSDGWTRWWAHLLDSWWDEFPENPGPLMSTPANERVEFLKSILSLDLLTTAKPMEEGYSTCFWTLCADKKEPLDPKDGLLVADKKREIWQDTQYISIKAALENRNGIRVHSWDTGRFRRIKELQREKYNH